MMSSLAIIAGVIGASFGLSPNSAGAQTMKPGLWEMNSKVGGSPEMDKAMAQMQQQMASMPPEQRKMMEDMMAKKGMSMGGAGGGGMVVKACISKEMAERSQMPMQQKGDCSSTISDQTSTGMTMRFTCLNPPSNGEGQFTFSGNSAYTMKMKVNSSIAGKVQTTTMDGTGKWLGADCGSIKPMAMPKQ